MLTAIAREVGSNAKVTVVLPNEMVGQLADSNYAGEVIGNLSQWRNIISTVAVGNGPENHPGFSDYFLGDQLVKALSNVRSSIEAGNFPQGTTVTVPFTPSILDGNILAPSNVTIKPRYSYAVRQVLGVLSTSNSSFQMNLYPYYVWYFNREHVSIPFATFNSTGQTIVDDGHTYHNLFDVLHDGVRVALDKYVYLLLLFIKQRAFIVYLILLAL